MENAWNIWKLNESASGQHGKMHHQNIVRSIQSRMGLCYCPGTATTTFKTITAPPKSLIITLPSEARGCYTKSIQGLERHFSPQNDHNNHLAIIKLIHFPDAPDQK